MITMKEMLEAGVHFGHKTRYWNPKMAPYIYGERGKVHIINLEKTLPMYKDAVNFLGSIAAKGGKILFVGTKRPAQLNIEIEANRAGMPYVNHRWLGGMLTNYKTIRQSIKRLKKLEAMDEDGGFEKMIKKEALKLKREMAKLQRSFDGIKNMAGIPDALFVIDSGIEKIAVSEGNKLGIPVISVVDTNSNPDNIDYLIPGNDDAIRAISLYLKYAVDAILDAKEAAKTHGASQDDYIEITDDELPKKKAKTKADTKITEKKSLSKAEQTDAAAKEAPISASETKTEAAKPATKKPVTTAKKAPEPEAKAKTTPKKAPEAKITDKKAPAKKTAAQEDAAKKA